MKLLIGVLVKKEKKEDNQYKLKKAMAIAIGLMNSIFIGQRDQHTL